MCISRETNYSPPSKAESLHTTSSVARDRFRFDLRFELLSFSRLGKAVATPSEEHIAAGLCCNDPNNTGSSNTDEDSTTFRTSTSTLHANSSTTEFMLHSLARKFTLKSATPVLLARRAVYSSVPQLAINSPNYRSPTIALPIPGIGKAKVCMQSDCLFFLAYLSSYNNMPENSSLLSYDAM
jgi:hypothetical protein